MTARLTFWGTRGSIPVPGPATVRHGGNTPCVALESAAGLVILDAGSGLRPLGETLRGRGTAFVLLLTHVHWDHIQGLPFFAPLFEPATRGRVLGPRPQGNPLARILDRQMDPDVFPVPFSGLPARLDVTEITEGPLALPEVEGTAFRLHHPGVTLGYRLRPPGGGREVAYVTDNELRPDGDFGAGWRAGLLRWLEGADTLVHDAMYDEATLARRAGWGHSGWREAVDLAVEAGCRRLVLFHHDPGHDDATLDGIGSAAAAHAARVRPGLEVLVARDGLELTL